MEYIKKEYFWKMPNYDHKLHVIVWKPEKVIAVLQIFHGMTEHIDRFDELADYMASRGILVFGEDHLGHGKTAVDKKEFGYFSEGNVSKIMTEGIHALTLEVKEKYKNIPFYILGHSMGSFMLRRYIMEYGKDIDGCIVQGTGRQKKGPVIFGQVLVRIIGAIKGEKYISPLVISLTTGDFNSEFGENETENAWTTSDMEMQRKFLDDPLSGFPFTVNGYRFILDTFRFIQKEENIARIPKKLPIFMISGNQDVVGEKGAGVRAIYQQYIDAGLENVELKLYENARHELHHEKDRREVYHDILDWMNKKQG